MPGTVAELLRARAGDDRIALCFEDTAWTWRQVVGECAARAAWMTAMTAHAVPAPAGHAPGASSPPAPPHVGVLLDNTPEFVFLLGGAALSGSVVVALNGSRGPAELAADAARADCDLLVGEPRHAAAAEHVAREWGARLVSVAEPARSAPHTEPTPAVRPRRSSAPYDARLPGESGDRGPRVTPETLLMLIFTSGTAGRPRAVRVTHRKVVVPGAALASRLLGPEDVVYCPMPLFHSGAVMAAYAPWLAAGARLVLRRRFSASGTLPDLRRYGCTYLHYVGKALSYVLDTPERPGDAENPLRVAFGNEAAPLEQRRFAERFGCAVFDGYGSTETGVSLSPDPAAPPGALGRLGAGVAILDQATGRECPPARLDADGRLTNADEAVGELVNTSGAGLFDGYYGEPAGDRMRDGMFWSGDLAYRDTAGFAYFAGRGGDRLRVDGENFGAVQVERALGTLPGVTALAAYGVPDVAAGDQVMVALAGEFDPCRFAAFLAGCTGLSPKWTPRYVRVMAALPTTASHKVLRRRLAADAWNTRDPVWWRPGREPAFRRMTAADVARLREEFECRGRAHLWPTGSPG